MISAKRSMTALMSALLFLALVQRAFGVEVTDIRVNQLEQDVLQLRQQVQQQARRIEMLESALALPQNGSRPNVERKATSTDSARPWLTSSNWEKVKIGMPEADVLRILGPPTTSRAIGAESNSKTLYYSIELDAGGFLSGRILVADQRVTEIHKPMLR